MAMANPIEVTDADFQQRVLERSAQVPVLVDFWADWCQPCHMLAPVIEQAVDAHPGKIELAKLDTEANQATAARYGIRGLPTVKAFRNGEVVDEFTGAQPPLVVERFVAGLVPSEADELVGGGDEQSLRRALEVDPGHAVARRELGKLLLRKGEAEEALTLLEGLNGDFLADGLAARARLAGDEDLAPAFEAWDEGDHATALELLQAGLADPERRDAIRRIMVAIFTELGADDPLAREYRRRLSAALN
jgi:putative thioredoxin